MCKQKNYTSQLPGRKMKKVNTSADIIIPCPATPSSIPVRPHSQKSRTKPHIARTPHLYPLRLCPSAASQQYHCDSPILTGNLTANYLVHTYSRPRLLSSRRRRGSAATLRRLKGVGNFGILDLFPASPSRAGLKGQHHLRSKAKSPQSPTSRSPNVPPLTLICTKSALNVRKVQVRR